MARETPPGPGIGAATAALSRQEALTSLSYRQLPAFPAPLLKRLPLPLRVLLPPAASSACSLRSFLLLSPQASDKEAEPHLPLAPHCKPASSLRPRLRCSPRNCFWTVLFPVVSQGLSSEPTLCPAGRLLALNQSCSNTHLVWFRDPRHTGVETLHRWATGPDNSAPS